MLEFLRGKVSDRKLRLFAVTCCRRIWSFLADERSRKAVDCAERFADRNASEVELADASQSAGNAWDASLDSARPTYHAAQAATFVCRDDLLSAHWAAQGVVRWSVVLDDETQAAEEAMFARIANSWSHPTPTPVREEAVAAERSAQIGLLADIFGPLPFRPIVRDPAWHSSTVVSLATSIYDERAFDRLPILADALEDAGCDNADILNHCRQPGEHVRGCWIVDLVTGKE